jgi:hypothetical protein
MSARRRLSTVAVTMFCTALGGLALAGTPAPAAQLAPGWEVFGHTGPTILPPGGVGDVYVYAYNTGAAEGSAGVLRDTLPAGLTATGGSECTGTKVVECKVPGLPPGQDKPYEVAIPVSVAGDATGEETNGVTVEGGGALTVARSSFQVKYGAGIAAPGLSSADAWATNTDGTADTQAGSHPYELTVAFAPTTKINQSNGVEEAIGEPRDIDVKLPPGLVGNASVVPECQRAKFDEGQLGEESDKGCPPSTRIGFSWTALEGRIGGEPVYNIVPPPGLAAQFGFEVNGITALMDVKVRTGGDAGLTVHVNNVPERKVLFSSTTIWGSPSEPELNIDRGAPGQEGCVEAVGGGCTYTGPPVPFLTMPTSCQGPQVFGIEELGTWEDIEADSRVEVKTHNSEDVPVGFTGCERLLRFNPSIAIAPDTTEADTPAGLTATVKVPQNVNPEELATSGLRDTTVTLPEGIAINPGQATGLAACQSGRGPGTDGLPNPGEDGESEAFDAPPECPSASKVGEDEISTPLLPDRLKGNVYVLQSNPPELKLLVAASGDGVNLKLIGTVHLNTTTGQLVTTFENTPDAPLNEFKLEFSGGAQAALVTPPTCRVYTTNTAFTPWGSPFVENALVSGRFAIETGPGGGPCTQYGSPLPFSPSLTAGATTDQAGGFTDFSLLLQRGDGQQRFSSLSFKAPAGLAAMLASVPLCGEAQANAGTCSSASQIGHAVVGAGPGPDPFYIPQNGAPPAAVYLTGQYHGAPFGLSIVTPVVAGPFNLGTNVVRAKIEVNPLTAQITVTTDPSGPHSIPTILDGIPTDIRSINTVIDRPGFMFNPTNCNPQEFSGTAYSGEGASAPISTHFQMGSCRSLEFKPDFKVSTSGKTSKKYGASLVAKILYPTGPFGANQASSQSNIASVKVDLPKQLPSRLTTLQKACTAAVFEANPANCPATSVVGRASAVTPVLPVPLVGPAYFVSHGGEAFPSLEVILQGDGVTINLVGTTFISKAGITSSTFKQVPDVPISSFELNLPTGPYSALTANLPASAKYSLCGQKLTMPTAFTGQNGAVIHQSTPVTVTGCPKTKKATKKPKKKAHKSSRNSKGRK